MFGNNNSVLSDGAPGHGVVFWRFGPRGKTDGGHVDTYRIQVRVKFDDGSTTDLKKKRLHISKHGLHIEGQTVPVRYDPADHSNVEIDLAALAAEHSAAKDAVQRSAAARVEQALNEQTINGPTAEEIRNPAPGDPLPTLDQIRNAGKNSPPSSI
jgi:hypothetical protein